MKNYTSPLCSCITCKEIKSAKGIYSHVLSAHTEEGNAKRKLYGKMGALKGGGKNRKIKLKKEYDINKKKCKFCNIEIDYDKRVNNFCDQSCSAKYENLKRKENNWAQSDIQRKVARDAVVARYEQKPKYTKVTQCVICRTWFKSKGANKTCSLVCRRFLRSDVCRRTATMRYQRGDMFGGNKTNSAYGWYKSPTAGKVWLESTYEHRVAIELDQNNIPWIRPKSLPYFDGTTNRRYFPDFYLPTLNVYLDPKNDYLIEKDRNKIGAVIAQNNVRVVVLNKNQLSLTSILQLGAHT